MTSRAPYQGVLQIFKYNRPFYTRTFAGAVAALIVSIWLPLTLRLILLLGIGAAVFWMCMSLLVSHYVYDRSHLYNFAWLAECLSKPPVRWVNIHSGIDEASPSIASLFPGSQGQVLDIYDPVEMTEPSIGQARQLALTPSTPADWSALPAADHEFDTVFLIFSAHELRRKEAREKLFREVARVLSPEGELVLVEHLRDLPNFLAFGPGCLHFLSCSTWQHAATASGLRIRFQRTLTPFVHIFVLRKPE